VSLPERVVSGAVVATPEVLLTVSAAPDVFLTNATLSSGTALNPE